MKKLYTQVKNSDFNVLLAFPGPKSFAMSSLGYMWMLKKLDEKDGVNVEPIFSDTAFTKTKKADMLGFSFTFDMDFYGIFSLIEKLGYKLKACEREENSPLIFAGGPVVSANPKPYTDFFDFFIIGDGELINTIAVDICRKNRNRPKIEILKELAKCDGIYVPKFFPKKVKKITQKLDDCIYTPILSDEAYFKNTFIIELERGCSNRCGFCLASYLNLPIRFVPYEKVIEAIDLGLEHTDKIALLGAQLTSHPRFKDICKFIYDKVQAGQKISMSVSSMRVDAFCPEIVKTLVACGQKNTTLAIEAGSERLRKIINKNLTEEQIFDAVKIAVDNGLKGFKFYGMIGLPTETQEDINEMISLGKRIKEKYKGFDISFGISSFVPKPHTPFQWIGREDTKSLEKKAQYLKKEFHKIGIRAQISSIKWDYWQAVLSRGDETLGDFLVEVYKNKANIGAFKTAAKGRIDADYFALANIEFEKDLPWDFIEIAPGKEFLIKENKRLLET